jgi:outer membrane protein assembly factor BamB
MKTFALVPVLILTITPLTTQAADWNQWRGAARNGVAADSPPLLDALPPMGLKPVWTSQDEIASAQNGGWSSPVVVDGKVYIFTHKKTRFGDNSLPKPKYPWLPPENRGGMSDEEYAQYERNRRDEDEARSKFFRYDEVTFCLNAQNGQTIWKNERKSVYTRFPQSGSPAVVDGKLYTLGAGLVARCIDAVTGADVWQTSLPGQFRDEMMQSSFVVADGAAVVLANELFGLDAQSGQILWQTHQDDDRILHTSPVVWQNGELALVICNLPSGETICVDPKTGTQLWRIESFGGNSTPIVAGDLLLTYGSSRKGGLRCYKLSLTGAEHLWTCQRTADPGSSPVVVGNCVFVQGERRLACVSLADGTPLWMTDLDLNNPRYTSLVAADNKVVYTFDGMLLFAADAGQYRQLINAKFDTKGLLAEETVFRKMLNIDELERSADGQKEAERLWREKIGNGGPLPCATPAIVDGRIYLRLKNSVACYDLRSDSSSATE